MGALKYTKEVILKKIADNNLSLVKDFISVHDPIECVCNKCGLHKRLKSAYHTRGGISCKRCRSKTYSIDQFKSDILLNKYEVISFVKMNYIIKCIKCSDIRTSPQIANFVRYPTCKICDGPRFNDDNF